MDEVKNQLSSSVIYTQFGPFHAYMYAHTYKLRNVLLVVVKVKLLIFRSESLEKFMSIK